MTVVQAELTGYVVEVYTPRTADPACMRADAERIRRAVGVLAATGARIRYLHSLLIPGEETALHLVEGESPTVIAAAMRKAGVDAERISPADWTLGARTARFCAPAGTRRRSSA